MEKLILVYSLQSLSERFVFGVGGNVLFAIVVVIVVVDVVVLQRRALPSRGYS